VSKEKTYIGLDIGSSAVKFVEVSVNGGTVCLTRSASLPLDPNLDPVPALQRLLQGKKSREIVSAASETFVVSRFFTLPIMAGDEFERFLRLHAPEYLPAQSRIEEVALDYQILQKDIREDNEVALVLIAACKRLAIREHLTLLHQAGVYPSQVDASAIPLLNTFTYYPTIQSGQATAILDIGARKTNLLFIENKILKFVTEIPLGGNAFTDALVGRLGVSFETAEEEKKKSGAGEDPKIKEGLQQPLEDLLTEIEKVILYYQPTEEKKVRLSTIILTGGACRTPGLVELFREKFGAEVEIGNPFGALTLKGPPPENPPSFALAVGLALKKVHPEINTINLLPSYDREAIVVIKTKGAMKRYALLSASVLLAFFLILLGGGLFFRHRLQTTETQYRSLRADLDKALALKSENDGMKSRLQLIRDLSQGNSRWSAILLELSKQVPKELWLTELRSEERLAAKGAAEKKEGLSRVPYLRMVGLTYSQDRLKELLSSLSQSKTFGEVELVYAEKGKENPGEGLVRFEIRMKVVP
jgi:type IV pilus assembly protein PilM